MRPDACNPARGAGRVPAPRLPWLCLALAGLAGVLHLLPGVRELLVWDRGALEAGELWRLASGHWVHWSDTHLAWDLATFGLLGAACELRSRRSFVACVALSGLAIALALWAWQPGLDACAGLSGIDCALFAWLAFDLVRERWCDGRLAAALVLAGFCSAFAAKLAFELNTGAALFVSDLGPGVVPVPAAHLVGALAGIVVALSSSPLVPAAPRRFASA